QRDEVRQALEDARAAYREYYDRHPRFMDAQAPLGIAYFSLEFGLSECLPIYSGGLGVLAADHLKSSSDLGLPLVAVGLLYRQGYFLQDLDRSSWQNERYVDLDVAALPIERVIGAGGAPLSVTISIAHRTVHLSIWRVHFGRVGLY